MKNLIIIGRRWFNKTYGNTYHSVEICIDEKTVHLPYRYGYSDQYLHTAIDYLKKEKLIVTDKTVSWQIFDELREKGVYIKTFVFDVNRKKDL